MFEDEVFFQQSGSTHRTFAKIGTETIVKSEPVKRCIKALGAVSDEQNPSFYFKFAPVFNQETFFRFLKKLVKRYAGKKIFMILDNTRYHHARTIKEWFEENSEKIELHFLPPYSPNLNPIEKVWKKVKKESIHNKHFRTQEELKMKVFRRFNRIKGNLASVTNLIIPNLMRNVQ